MEENLFEKAEKLVYEKLDLDNTGKIKKSSLIELLTKLSVPSRKIEISVEEVFDEETSIEYWEAEDYMIFIGCFLYADKEKCGKISLSEVLNFYTEAEEILNLKHVTPKEIADDFRSFDKNNIGKITLLQFNNIFELRRKITEANPRKNATDFEKEAFLNKLIEIGFDRMDTDHDGKLTRENMFETAEKLNLSPDTLIELKSVFKFGRNYIVKGEGSFTLAIFGQFFYVNKSKDYEVKFEEVREYIKEAKQFLGLPDAPKSLIMKEFKHFDRNNDNTLNFEEFGEFFNESLTDLFNTLNSPK